MEIKGEKGLKDERIKTFQVITIYVTTNIFVLFQLPYFPGDYPRVIC